MTNIIANGINNIVNNTLQFADKVLSFTEPEENLEEDSGHIIHKKMINISNQIIRSRLYEKTSC